MTFVDKPGPIRSGEELDTEKLAAFLARELGESAPLEVKQFPGGHSNLSYLVRYGDRDLVLRRPPFGSKVKSAHDMGREFRVLSKLGPAYAKAPTPLLHCEDESVLGAPFYLMERVEGVILRKSLPAGLTLSETKATSLCHRLIDTLAELHSVDFAAIGLGDLGKPEGYVDRQVGGWRKRYAGSQTDDIESVESVGQWLGDNKPTSQRAALIHNDFKFDNLVFAAPNLDRVLGILDWEMCTLGDPLMDLGTALGYWAQRGDPQPVQMIRFGPTTVPGMLTRIQLAERYAERTGANLDNIVFYYVFGLFKTAVVAQQIYYRFHQGLTKDPRFAQFIHAVRILSDQARAAIDRMTL
jgi:aminoglycoside phosphotransferase (APT) family kinase protein